MPNKFAWFLTLAIFSGLSMNLIFRFGIGLQKIASGADSRPSEKSAKWVFFLPWGIYFISVMILWLVFSLLQSVLFLGFAEYILIFPVSCLFFTVIEYLVNRLIKFFGGDAVSIDCFYMTGEGDGGGGALNSAAINRVEIPVNSAAVNRVEIPVNGAMIGAALFIILGLANSIAEAAMLSFGFSAGAVLAVLIIGEIRRRSWMEAVPRRLRGGPLVLVTMGLLSLVFTSAAMIFYTVLGAK